MSDDAHLVALKERAADFLLRIPGVTGVGLGGRERAGQPTGEIVLKVFVREKRPLEELEADEVIPTEVEGLPTDVVVLRDAEEEQAPPGKPDGGISDDNRQRPLVGGSMCQVDLSGPRSGPGTLGCFLIDPADTTKVYALTNWHVLDADNEHPVVRTTKVGQPSKNDSSTKCCSAIIGKVAGGSKDSTRDAGIAQLDPGMEWRADILEIGAVKGAHTITVAEAATLTYQVRKRGIKTRLTGGVVQAINVSMTVSGIARNNLTVVRPNPDPSQPAGTPVFFSRPGDSGAVVVNADNQVVSLHFAKATAAPHIGSSVSFPIADVLTRFQAVESLTLTVATATEPGITRTVPGAAMVAVPEEVVSVLPPRERVAASGGVADPERVRVPVAAWLPGLAPPAPSTLARMQRDLDGSYAGRSLISLWLNHHDEITTLLSTNSRVATTWHRSGAAAVMQLLSRSIDDPDVAVPATVNGRPLTDVLDRLRDVFRRFGSTRLRADIARARDMFPDPAGLTYHQIIQALDAI